MPILFVLSNSREWELWGHRQTFHFGQELRGNPHAFRFVFFLKRCRLRLDRLMNSTILMKLASISPKWDLNTETAQLRRLPQVLHAMNAQYAQQNWNASSSVTRQLDSVSCTADGECGCESARSPSACQLPC